MTALAAARGISKRNVGYLMPAQPVAASTTIWKGAMVCINAAGYAVPASDTSGLLPVCGVADETVVNSGAAGAKFIRLQTDAYFEFNASSITQAMVGDTMYVVDDNTFDDAAGPTNDVPAGILVQFVSTTKGMIKITPTVPAALV